MAVTVSYSGIAGAKQVVLFGAQYSLGSKSVVTERSPSVKTQSLSVFPGGPTSYADKIRAPLPMAA